MYLLIILHLVQSLRPSGETAMATRRTRRLTRSEDDDWDDVKDAAERRRLQNRKNQRNFRARRRQKEKEMQATDTAAPNAEELVGGDGSITVVPSASDNHQDRYHLSSYDSHPAEESQPVPMSPFVVLQSPSGVFAMGEHYYHTVNSNPIATLDPSSRK